MIFFKIFVEIFRNVTFLFFVFFNIFSSGLFYNIYIADKFTVFTNREMERSDLFAIKLCQFLYYFTVADIIYIHICYKEHTRKFIFFAQVPCLLSSHLNSGLTGNNDDRCICCADSLFYLTYKIKVSRSVKDIDLYFIPRNRNQRSRN